VGAVAQERRVIGDKEIEPAANVAVEDEGIGIRAEKLPRIFDDYYRADTISVAVFAERSVRSRYKIYILFFFVTDPYAVSECLRSTYSLTTA